MLDGMNLVEDGVEDEEQEERGRLAAEQAAAQERVAAEQAAEQERLAAEQERDVVGTVQ